LQTIVFIKGTVRRTTNFVENLCKIKAILEEALTRESGIQMGLFDEKTMV
jgi:hypothetical protein